MRVVFTALTALALLALGFAYHQNVVHKHELERMDWARKQVHYIFEDRAVHRPSNQVMIYLKKGGYSFSEPNATEYDPWGNAIEITYSCLPEEDIIFQVRSSGRDGYMRTTDDLFEKGMITSSEAHMVCSEWWKTQGN